jgi:hypothetical protein
MWPKRRQKIKVGKDQWRTLRALNVMHEKLIAVNAVK